MIRTTTELLAELLTAKAGDKLLLAPGDFDQFGLSGVKRSGRILIASADPGNPARFRGVEIEDCSGIKFLDVAMRLNARTQTICNITNSSDIELQRVDFADKPGSPKNGLMFRWCRNVAVADSLFHDCGTAIRNIDSVNVSIVGSTFRDIRGDGIQTTGCSDVRLIANQFTNFFPGPGDHPDAVQFFTLNQKAPARNIVIADNLITRGRGGIVQGIFMGNEGNQPYENVRIEGNALAGTMYNGIALGSGRNVSVIGNFVLPYADMDSWIRLDHVHGVALNDNSATQIVLEGCKEVKRGRLVKLGPSRVGDERRLQAWLAERRVAAAPGQSSSLARELTYAGLALALIPSAVGAASRRGVLASLAACVASALAPSGVELSGSDSRRVG